MILAYDVRYGERLLLPGKHPRRELLAKLGRSHAEKIYRDAPDGSILHIGYYVAGGWWQLYNCIPFTACKKGVCA